MRLNPQKSILLRLLLPLNNQVRPTIPNRTTKHDSAERASLNRSIGCSDRWCVQRAGVYKGQGRNRRWLVFLVQDEQLQRSFPSTNAVASSSFPASGNPRRLAAALSVARVWPGTSKGITDLLLPRRLRLDASPAVPRREGHHQWLTVEV